jgi:phosphatidylserine/phosphatidylglycerophosphate/cardiolipin synthase-like enzyme
LTNSEALAQLREKDLRSLALAIRTERVYPPFPFASLARITGSTMAGPISVALQTLSAKGCSSEALATCVEMIAEVSDRKSSFEDSVQLVMTGPLESSIEHRDTKVVVADLFRRAETSVLIAGYAIHQGRHVLEELATRMESSEGLNVQMFLNLGIRPGTTETPVELVARFVREFKTRHWPSGYRLPEVYYDRRVLAASNRLPVSLHAKCVVRDNEELFVSSANFTEAAQNRNIELGVLMTSPSLAKQTTSFFGRLVKEDICVRAI